MTGKKRGTGARNLKVRVKTARGRRLSSTRWLQRQLNDPYVHAAQREGYRSRAAYKLLQLDERFSFLKPGHRVLDLGAAPGGWCQVAARAVNAGGEKAGVPAGKVVGVDLQEMEPLSSVELVQLDFLEEGAEEKVQNLLGGTVDVVLSDMAASSTGHCQTDHLRIMALCEAAAMFARDVLAENGVFVAKVLQGGTEMELLTNLKKDFARVKHVKPAASRKDSSEMYVVAMDFRGADN